MELELVGQRITQETVDFAVSLRTDADYEIRIETDFTVHTPNGDIDYSIGETGLDPDKFRSLLQRRVTSSAADESGALLLAFEDGTGLRVEPNETYEAWTIAGPHGRKVVCMAHGELAVWSAQGR